MVTYTVTHAESIPGAGMVVVASELEATIETFDAPRSGEVGTISRITLGTAFDPRQRLIEVKAGCLFFHRGTSDPVTFEVRPAPRDRPAKMTLLLGDAQSSDAPRRSEIEFASPANASRISLGRDETGLIANDGCHWDTLGRNSGAEPPVEGCTPALFPMSNDPDRRGEVTIPARAESARVQFRSPAPQTSNDRRGVSAVLNLAVLELVILPGE